MADLKNFRQGRYYPVWLGMDAFAFHFILGDQLVGSAFEDETACEILGWGGENKTKQG